MHSEPTEAQATAPAPRRTRHALDALLAPRSVAVVGAAEEAGSPGRALLWNLIKQPVRRHRLPGHDGPDQRPRHPRLPID